MKYILYRIKYGPIFRFKHHLFDIELHSVKQYNDLFESKKMKLFYWLGLITYNYNSPIGINLYLSYKNFEDEELNRIHSKQLKYFITICKQHIMQQVKGFGYRVGYLIGILITQEDYYYILMDDKGNRWYETCCSKLEFIK